MKAQQRTTLASASKINIAGRMWSTSRLYPPTSSQNDTTVTQQNLPFKCFSCDDRFSNSTHLVQHIKDFHSRIVENAEQKIDQSKEFSASVSKMPSIQAACPYCDKDCQTRKLLMRHLEVEHRDQDGDDEPEVKFIRLTPVSKPSSPHSQISPSSLSKSLSPQSATDTETNLLEKLSQTAIPPSVTNNGGFVHQLLTVFDPNGLTPNDRLAHDRLAALKFPEKRYKCFWCEVSFRKRGKLMDHIDMFHKANKHQTEVEAEMIHGTSKSEEMQLPTPVSTPVPAFFNVVPFIRTSQRPTIITPIPGTSQICMPLKIAHKKRSYSASSSVSTHSNQTTSSGISPRMTSKPTSPTYKPKSSRPQHQVCTFEKLGWLHREKPSSFGERKKRVNNCKFFHTGRKNFQTKQKLATTNMGKSSGKPSGFVLSSTATPQKILIPAHPDSPFSPKDTKTCTKSTNFTPHVFRGAPRGVSTGPLQLSSPPMFVYANNRQPQPLIQQQQFRMPFFIPSQTPKSTTTSPNSQFTPPQRKRYDTQDQPVNYTNMEKLPREFGIAQMVRSSYNPDSPLDLTTK